MSTSAASNRGSLAFAMITAMNEARISVRVQARARADELVALRAGVLIVRVTAPPLDGRANAAACRLLAAILDVRASQVGIVRGEHARDKVIAVAGVDQQIADAAIAAAVGLGSH